MKRVIKQPCLWIFLCSLVLAIGIAVGSSFVNPGIGAIDKFEKGMNQRKAKTIISCFTPEAQAELQAFAELSGEEGEAFGFLLSEMPELGRLNILYGDIVEDEYGDLSVPAFLIYNLEGQYEDVEYEEFELEEVDGKVYLSGF